MESEGTIINYSIYVLQQSPEVVSTSTPSPDGVGSSLVAKMSRPLSLFPAPWFTPKDKSRHTEQLQKELDDAAEALLRTRSRLSQLESVSFLLSFLLAPHGLYLLSHTNPLNHVPLAS